VVIEGVTAPAFALRRQQQPAVLALVAIDVVTLVQGHDSDSLVLTRFGQNRLHADAAPRGKFLVEVLNAMNPINVVHRKRDPIQAFPTHDARETVRMIRLSSRT
jgi:hypothetical protein